jgi:hypothetical protein
MAVLDTLPGIEVTIKSQGRTLPEYPDDGEWSNRRHHAPVPAEKRTSVYVECVSDAKFEVVSSIKPPYKFVNCQMLSFWIYVDGQAVGGASSRKIVDGRWKELMAASCARTGLNQVSRRAFKFASIQKGRNELFLIAQSNRPIRFHFLVERYTDILQLMM